MERRCVLNSWSKEEVRAVIRYEWARGVSGTEIHNRLVEVYGPGVMSKQMVRRWCLTFSDGRQQEEDIPRAGRTRTATTDANVGKVDDMIRVNRRITINEAAEELGISHERAQNIIHDILRYRKVSARWVLDDDDDVQEKMEGSENLRYPSSTAEFKYNVNITPKEVINK
ncbi:histone-lysine N-methyltransferase SETMAR [Trichonephila inaurata madagascariensis]|uniref:Histone-lysine N-methyltransferase SETMAR n=1 Tax=Trichonephila inaurata madagascariensis TaxID=2747483 RepID=A0A8X6IKH1_9ARAC|nr:histone-lysine N-methyltransferase SETMAR [Trichonephila inaurata madagascariensis]